MTRVAKSVDIVVEAFRKAPVHTIHAWPDGCGPTSVEEGYEIQAGVATSLGLNQVGWKVVDTFKTRDFKIKYPLYGRIFSNYVKEDASSIHKLTSFNLPRIEPQFVFRMGEDMNTPVDAFSIQSRISYMKSAIEITDSRYVKAIENSSSALADYVADNCRSGLLMLGDIGGWKDVDMATLDSLIYINKKKGQACYSTEDQNPLNTLIRFINSSINDPNVEIKKGQWVSVALNFYPQFIRPGDEIVSYTVGMNEVTVKFPLPKE